MDLKAVFKEIYDKPSNLKQQLDLKQTTLAPLRHRHRKELNRSGSESRLQPVSLQMEQSHFHDISIISHKPQEVHSLLEENQLIFKKLQPPRSRAAVLQALASPHVPEDIRKKAALYEKQSDLLYAELSISQQFRVGTLVCDLEKRLLDIFEKMVGEMVRAKAELLTLRQAHEQASSEKDTLAMKCVTLTRAVEDHRRKEALLKGSVQARLVAQISTLTL
jgi:hypothetical protein